MINFVKTEFAPHQRSHQSTFKKMMEFFICVGIIWLCSSLFYFIKRGTLEGSTVLINGLITMAFAVIPDLIYNLPLLFKKDFEGNKFKEYLYRVVRSYSYVTGLILLLLCPIGVKWYELALTSVLTITIAKLVFGGFGKNIVNPAVFGRVFIQLVFTGDLKTYLGNKPEVFDVTTGASLNGSIENVVTNQLGLGNTLIGNYFGALGETFALLLIVIAIYLTIRKITDWRIQLFYIVPLYISFVIMFLCMGMGANAFKDALIYTLSGGILFGSVICMTDPVTSPTSRSGRIIFALGAALITLIIRTLTGNIEGVAYSIVIMNCLVPLIDKVIKGRTNKNTLPVIITSCLGALIILVALVHGFTANIDPVTGQVVKSIMEVTR